jgi:glycosyltransferase involved in cell wall biosynthesis
MPPDVSVCIATHRRPAGLARLLESLARLKLPAGVGVEVLVVDNDPERSAAGVAEGFRDFPHPIRWLEEPRRNIAHARNRVVAEAKGRWLAFIDDDEAADEDWLAAYWRCVAACDCDGVFGPVLPRLEENVTPWLDPETFYVRPRHRTGAPLEAAELRTSNAMLRRSLFEDRRFDPAFGRSGGSDTELFGRMRRAGGRFCWCDEARVSEFIPPARHRPGWLAQRAFRGGFVHTRFAQRRWGRAGAARRGLPRALAALLLCGAWLPFAALGGRSVALRAWLRGCSQAGHLWAHLGLRYEEYGGS